MDHYAQLGLRTLCLAWRELREDEHREWSLLYKEASSTLVDREVKCTSQCIRFCIYIYIDSTHTHTHSYLYMHTYTYMYVCMLYHTHTHIVCG